MAYSFSVRSRAIAVVALAFAAGCSLVNSLDELKEPDDGKFSGETRPAATVSIDDAGFGPSSPVVDSGSDANTGEPFSPLVVGGEVNDVDSGTLLPTLTVLDAKTGVERGKRETMWVAGIAHDALRDRWYIFEGANYYIAAPTETVKIHIRTLDATSGVWTEEGVYEGPPLAYYDGIAVTRERITYVAHPADGKTNFRLITVNTSDTAHPALNAETDLPPGGSPPRGITGTPSVLGPGGNVNVMYVASTADCADSGAECPAKILHYLLPNGGVPQPPTTVFVGGMGPRALPGFNSLGCGGGDDVLVMPQVANDGTMVVGSYAAADSQDNGTQTFKMVARSSGLRRPGVDEQRRIAFVVETNTDTKLYAVPIGGTTPPGVNLGHSGQSVYYDPASSTVFAPFNQGEGKTFSPYRVSGDGKTPTTPVVLAERTQKTKDNPTGDWNPPDDLRPNILGIRRPATCP